MTSYRREGATVMMWCYFSICIYTMGKISKSHVYSSSLRLQAKVIPSIGLITDDRYISTAGIGQKWFPFNLN